MDYLFLTPLGLGILIGILMGLTGAGGGILSVPLLVFFLHLQVVEAAPIALTAIAISAGVGAFLGFRNKLLRYKAAVFMAIRFTTLTSRPLARASHSKSSPADSI